MLQIAQDKMLQITPDNFGLLMEWHRQMLADPQIRRFFGFTPEKPFPKVEDIQDGGPTVQFLTKDLDTRLIFTLDRPAREFNFGIYSLTPSTRRGKLNSGRAMHFLYEFGLKMYDTRAVTTRIHVTNDMSLSAMTAALGEPWGIEPGSAWDDFEQRWVDMARFRHFNNHSAQQHISSRERARARAA